MDRSKGNMRWDDNSRPEPVRAERTTNGEGVTRQVLIAGIAAALILGFGGGLLAGYHLAGEVIHAMRLNRDLAAIGTSVTSLELVDKSDRPDLRRLHLSTIASYATEAQREAAQFKKSPVRDPRLIDGLARGEAWATRNKVTAMATQLGALRQKVSSKP